MDPTVLKSHDEDESARFGVSLDDETFLFETWVEENNEHRRAMVEYEETLSWRGQTRVSYPRDEVWQILLESDEVLEWVEENEVQSIRRYE